MNHSMSGICHKRWTPHVDFKLLNKKCIFWVRGRDNQNHSGWLNHFTEYLIISSTDCGFASSRFYICHVFGRFHTRIFQGYTALPWFIWCSVIWFHTGGNQRVGWWTSNTRMAFYSVYGIFINDRNRLMAHWMIKMLLQDSLNITLVPLAKILEQTK